MPKQRTQNLLKMLWFDEKVYLYTFVIDVGDDDIQRYHKKVLEHDNNLFVSFYHHLSDTTYKHVYLNQKDAIACDILGYK